MIDNCIEVVECLVEVFVDDVINLFELCMIEFENNSVEFIEIGVCVLIEVCNMFVQIFEMRFEILGYIDLRGSVDWNQ